MAYPIAPGQPNYSGTFIPEIWSTKLIEKYYDATVLSQISNTDYEGEISNQGDKVIIRTRPTLDIHDYTIGQTLQNQRPEAPITELLIDKGFYWSTIIDDIVQKQQDIDQMNLWATDAAEQLKIKLDSRVLGTIVPDIAAANLGATAGRISGNIDLGVTGSPIVISKDGAATTMPIIDQILLMGQVLDEQNVPETGRFLLLPFWATRMLKGSDLKDASLTGDSGTPLRNGRVGMIDRFTVFNSNLLPRYADGAAQPFHIIAGTDAGLTFATQLTKTEELRAETTFGDIMRGLMVYGHKVVKPEALCASYVSEVAAS
jgi:hypothetical protein